MAYHMVVDGNLDSAPDADGPGDCQESLFHLIPGHVGGRCRGAAPLWLVELEGRSVASGPLISGCCDTVTYSGPCRRAPTCQGYLIH